MAFLFARRDEVARRRLQRPLIQRQSAARGTLSIVTTMLRTRRSGTRCRITVVLAEELGQAAEHVGVALVERR